MRGLPVLPFGLSDVGGLAYGLSLLAGLVLLFGILCLVYWTVPNRLVPWRAMGVPPAQVPLCRRVWGLQVLFERGPKPCIPLW